MKFTTMTARFPGTCKRCKQPINVGERIRYGGKGLTYHMADDCTGKPDAPSGSRLPEFETQRPDESRREYGLRAFTFVLATGVTATVDTDALDMADHAFPAIIGRAQFSDATIQSLARTRRLIVDTLSARAKDTTVPPQPEPVELKTPDTQDDGRGNVPVVVPDDQPPAPPAMMPVPTVRPLATVDAELF